MMFGVKGQLPVLLWALFFRAFELEQLHTMSSWQSQWFCKQWINILKLISTLTVRFNGNFRSCEKKACWETFEQQSASRCTQHSVHHQRLPLLSFTPAKKKPRTGSPPYSILQVALTSRQMKIDTTGTSCCGKSKQNISLAISFFLSIWLNSLSWVFKPHLPAHAFLGGWTTSSTLLRDLFPYSLAATGC